MMARLRKAPHRVSLDEPTQPAKPRFIDRAEAVRRVAASETRTEILTILDSVRPAERHAVLALATALRARLDDEIRRAGWSDRPLPFEEEI